MGSILKVKVLIAILFLVLTVPAQNGKPEPPVLPVPEVENLKWQNLLLRAQVLRAQAETVDALADVLAAEIHGRSPAGYRLSRHPAGHLEYVLKPTGENK